MKLNDSYNDDDCANIDQYGTSDKDSSAVSKRNSNLFNAKFIQSPEPKKMNLRGGNDSPPTPSMQSQRLRKEDDSMQINKMSSKKSAVARVPKSTTHIQLYYDENSIKGSPVRNSSKDYGNSDQDSPTNFIKKGVILMNGGGMQLHSPPIPKEEPGDLVENFAKTNKKPDVAQSQYLSKINKNSRFMSLGPSNISEKQYAKVVKQIMKDQSDHNRKLLLTPQSHQFIDNYEKIRNDQREFEERVQQLRQIRSQKSSINTQNEKIQQMRECTFYPRIQTKKTKQIPDRSLKEFLSSQNQHLNKTENKIQSLKARQLHQEKETHPHQPKILSNSKKMLSKASTDFRSMSPIYQRLYDIKNQNLKKQVEKIMKQDENLKLTPEQSVVSNSINHPSSKLHKNRAQQPTYKPHINDRSRKMKRQQPISQHLYKQASKKPVKTQSLISSSFVNTKSTKLLQSKFKAQYKHVLTEVVQRAQLLNQIEADDNKNALEQSGQQSDQQKNNNKITFEKKMLPQLMQRLGYIMGKEGKGNSQLEPSQKSAVLIQDLCKLCCIEIDDCQQTIDTHSLYQILAAISGFASAYIQGKIVQKPMDQPQLKKLKFGRRSLLNQDANNVDTQRNQDHTMTLQFYDEIRASGERGPMISNEGVQPFVEQSGNGFQPLVNNLQEKFDSLNQLAKENLFTVDGKLQLNEITSKKLNDKFALFSRNRRQFERKRKLAGQEVKQNLVIQPHVKAQPKYQLKVESQTQKNYSQSEQNQKKISKASERIVQHPKQEKKMLKKMNSAQGIKFNKSLVSNDQGQSFKTLPLLPDTQSLSDEVKESQLQQQYFAIQTHEECITQAQKEVGQQESLVNSVKSITQQQHEQRQSPAELKFKQKKQWLQKQREQKLALECTFQPRLISNAKSTSNLHGAQQAADRLFALAKKNKEKQQEFERKRLEIIQQKQRSQCTFKPNLLSSLSSDSLKNPNPPKAKYINQTIKRMKNARENEEKNKKQLERGIPGTEYSFGEQPTMKFEVDKGQNYKPSFDKYRVEAQTSKKSFSNSQIEAQNRGRTQEIKGSRNDQTNLGPQSKERLNNLLKKGEEKAKVAALKIGGGKSQQLKSYSIIGLNNQAKHQVILVSL